MVAWSLYKQKRNRIDMIFLIVSASDIFVGLLSIPMILLRISISDIFTLCHLMPVVEFFAVFPCGLSIWLTAYLSIERYLLLIHPIIYRKCIKSSRSISLTAFVCISIIFYAAFVSYRTHQAITLVSISQVINKRKFLDKVPQFLQWSAEVLFIVGSALINFKLYIHVRKEARNMKGNRHCKSAPSDALNMAIGRIIFAMIICELPHITLTFLDLFYIIDTKELKLRVVYWVLLLLYCRGFLNAVILLRSSKLRRK
ncbi:QRFP-like peptide receptor [Hydractinia symbiolongicarpus]|uniref:QRFP-like peptide receptor n=1 Tax=Hydractinia symbiolongicarpus TaxID=13093 RepID=UPI002550A027|nr:QRFP-like peptide receptor [Hydractinia symbiolongicarpus]